MISEATCSFETPVIDLNEILQRVLRLLLLVGRGLDRGLGVGELGLDVHRGLVAGGRLWISASPTRLDSAA